MTLTVGKTTTAVNLGVALAQQGKKVLLIDADAQANLTMSLGYSRPDDLPDTLSTIMQDIIDDKPVDVSRSILHHDEGVDLLPSNIELSGLEVRLINAISRESVLKTCINEVKKNYDTVLVDCMPSLGMLTINALAAADSVVIPTQPHYLSAKGLELLLRSVSKVKRQINPHLRIDGILAVVIILIVVLLGCAVSLFGGGSESTSYTPVSAEVEAYTPLIQKYAKQYGIPEYVELIKAVMMQESGGKGSDPMQAAEGSFNKRYPHEPNGIKDPEYSIECGVQELKAALVSAEVENPIDMERIKLALQGYNFGNGYISWAKTNYGGYSYANAVEFSAMQAQRLGWEKYGDTQYPAHVLRYYPYGRAFTSGGNQAIVEVALTQLGNEGGQPYWSWYGFGGRVEWCACFTSWCADQCGYLESGIIPKFSLCSDGVNWFKGKGQWQDKNYEPQAGDLIFFDWGSDGSIDHVGIVEKCENGTVYTVEGNSGDACKQQSYPVGSGSIYGYGCPVY